jgi:hypothetical protein
MKQFAVYNKTFVAAITPAVLELINAVTEAGNVWVTAVVTAAVVYLVPNAEAVDA